MRFRQTTGRHIARACVIVVCLCLVGAPALAKKQKAGEPAPGFDGYPVRDYTFLYARPWGMWSGSQSVMAGATAVTRLSDYFINSLQAMEGLPLRSLMLAVKNVLVDYPLAATAVSFNHLYVGHGLRAMEYGGHVRSLDVGTPFPYGRGSGRLGLDLPAGLDPLLSTMTGGVEANSLLAHHLVRAWAGGGAIPETDFWLYAQARLDLFFTVMLRTRAPSGFLSLARDDYDAYLTLVNNKYGSVFPHEYALKRKDLRDWSWSLILDPWLYGALGSWANGLATGKRSLPAPLIPLGKKAGMVPWLRTALTPWGLAMDTDILFRLPGNGVMVTTTQVSGDHFRGFWGISTLVDRMAVGKYVQMGGGAAFWRQPPVRNFAHFALATPRRASGHIVDLLSVSDRLTWIALASWVARNDQLREGASVHYDLAVVPQPYFRIEARVGYKTAGYLFGMPLPKGIFWHVGAGFIF